VWAFDNLYVAGNGVIPTGFTVNPTLTSVVYALKSADAIVARMRDAH
jgi:choline dehydrogenase-like flavoprotein